MTERKFYYPIGRKKVAIVGAGYVGASIAYALTQQSGNERFRTLVAIFGCYLKVFSDEPLPQDISRYVERLGGLPDLGGKEMQDCLPLYGRVLGAGGRVCRLRGL